MTTHEEIADYLLGAMADEDADRFEDALFGGALGHDDDASQQVSEVLQLLDLARSVHAVETTLGLTTTADAVAALESRGKKVQRYEVREGETVRAPVDPDAALVLSRLALKLEDVARVDLEILDVDGTTRGASAEDVEVDRNADCVWVPCDPRVAIAAQRTLFRLRAHHQDGRVTQHDYVGSVID